MQDRETEQGRRLLLAQLRQAEVRLEQVHALLANETPQQRVARRHMMRRTATMLRQAGEVRFIKDRGSDKNEWGWGTPGPSQREMDPEFKFDAKNLKPLAKSLRAALAALGHAMSAYNTFSKIKSARISPDGSLGGRGYIQKIPEMRRQLMNCVESLSSFTDTVYDELHASHWNPAEEGQNPRERDEVVEIMQDVEDIKSNPEDWAENEEDEMDEGEGGENG